MMMKFILSALCLSLFAGVVLAGPPMPPPPPDGGPGMMPPPPPDGGPGMMPPPPPPHERKNGKHIERLLSQLPEEDQAELKKQIRENPADTRKILHRYFEAQRKKDMERVTQLRDNYFNAKDEAEKAKALEALKADVRRETERSMKRMEKTIEDMTRQMEEYQKRLSRIKEHYEKRKANQDKNVEKILKDLTNPDKPFPPPPPPKREWGEKKQ